MLTSMTIEDFVGQAVKLSRPQYYCSACNVIVSRDDQVCPHCGAIFVGGKE